MDMKNVTSVGKATGGVTVFACVAVISTGCIPVNGPVAIGTLDGEFRVAACEELVVDGAYASIRDPGQEAERIWEAEGQVTIAEGTVVTLANDSFGMDTKLYREPRLIPGADLFFTFLGSPDPNSGTMADFSVPESGIEDGLWLTPDGEIQQTPCE